MKKNKKIRYETVDEEAARLVRGPRARFYGTPRQNFNRIARGAAAYGFLVQDSGGTVREPTEHDVAQFMIIVKTMRQADGYHRDSAVDQVGYAITDEICSEDGAATRFEEEVLL